MQDEKKSRAYSFHRTAAVSSRRGLTDTWGSLVPPGRSRGHTGRWSEPLGPAQCGTSSSSRSGSQAGRDTSRFGTPLRKERKNRNNGGLIIELCRWVFFAFGSGSVEWRVSSFTAATRGRREKQHYIWFRRDIATHLPREGAHRRRLMYSYCALAWPCDRMMDFICVGQHSNTITDGAVQSSQSGFNQTLLLKQSSWELLQTVSHLSD